MKYRKVFENLMSLVLYIRAEGARIFFVYNTNSENKCLFDQQFLGPNYMS